MKQLRYEPWREEHKMFVTQTTVWRMKPCTWTLFLPRPTPAQMSSNAIRLNGGSKHSYTTTATIPYKWRTSETVAHIIWSCNIRVYTHKPMFTLGCVLTNVKDKEEHEARPGAIYKIKCSHCQATYVSETGRNLTNEHKWATKRGTSTTTSLNTT